MTIVGAGIGGLSTGLRLLHAGYTVTIYEKNSQPGGVLSSISSPDGAFKFDESSSIPINPLTYFEIFKDLGKDPKDYLDWVELEPYYKVFFSSQKSLRLHTNLSQTQEALKTLWPKDLEGYTKYVFDTSLKYLTAKKHLLNRTFTKSLDLWAPSTLFYLLKIFPFTSASSHVAHYIDSQELRQLILFQTFFMGISPYQIPNIYTAIPAQSQVDGLIHFKGGLSAYTKALARLFEELGGKIYYNHPISKVFTSSKQAKGVICDKTFIPSDLVILNSDFTYSQKRLLPSRKMRSFKYSCSTFIVHLGLNKKFEELEVHNLYLNKHFKKEVNRVFKGKLPITPSLYIYSPSCIDDSFCVNSKYSIINIMIRVPNLCFTSINWDNTAKHYLYNLCVKLLSTIPGLSYIDNHIIYSTITTPISFKKKYHYTYGSCFGIGHTFFQSMAFRPQVKDTQFDNLYYIGTSIHPGNGASIVMDASKLLVKTITHRTH